MRDLNELPNNVFRGRFREYLLQNYPDAWKLSARRPFLRLRGSEATRWLCKLHSDGWRAPAWPVEYGGLGLTFDKQLIYREELERARVARLLDMAENLVGPVLIQFGSDAQRQYFLPRALNCEHVWCQGYSEPNAGSDLASLRTSAVLQDDVFVLNGQKTWTTHATEATHMFLLARTSKGHRKQDGISFLLLDLNTPGITIRPIVNLVGEDEFCEVFLEDVKVQKRNLVGEIDQGWNVAKALLGHERIFLGSPALAAQAFSVAEQVVQAMGLQDDMAVMDRLGTLALDLHCLRALYSQVCESMLAGHAPGPEVSCMKIIATELVQRITEFSTEVAAEFGGTVGDISIANVDLDLHWQFMLARPMTIYGGSSEVQRNILAKNILNLPSAR